MKIYKIIFCFSLFQFASTAKSQINIDSILNTKTNKDISFSLSNPVRIYDSSGAYYGTRRIVMLNDTSFNMIMSVPMDISIPILRRYLMDEDRDWMANLILYSITESDAISLFRLQPNNVLCWKQKYKNKDVDYWSNYQW